MKPKFLHVLFYCALGAIFVAMNAAVVLYVLRNRKPASTQDVKVATYDPTPGRYASLTRFEFSTVPARLQAGELSMWSLKIVDPKKKDRHGQPKYVRSFVQQGGNLINLVVVSDDLGTFKRFAPDYKDYGHFLLQTSLPQAGTYRLYADYIPYNGRREVKQQTLEVAGAATNPASEAAATASADSTSAGSTYGLAPQRVKVQAEGETEGSNALYTVELETLHLAANRKAQLHFTVRDDAGNALNDLQPYFGAPAQCVVISRDKQIYLHPQLKGRAARNQGIIFETQFPQAGEYKVWLQFQHRNSVVTAPFMIRIAPASSDTTTDTVSKATNALAEKKG